MRTLQNPDLWTHLIVTNFRKITILTWHFRIWFWFSHLQMSFLKFLTGRWEIPFWNGSFLIAKWESRRFYGIFPWSKKNISQCGDRQSYRHHQPLILDGRSISENKRLNKGLYHIVLNIAIISVLSGNNSLTWMCML